jgi:dienelactone hydrolase
VRLALAAVVALVLAAPAAALSPRVFENLGPGCTRADFSSGDGTVPAELCRRDGEHAAVVVLHGCGGFGTLDHKLAARLPSHGFATLYVDYFALTPHGPKGFCGGRGRSSDPFPNWIQTARDAAAALRRMPGIDPKRVGAVGWSLGGAVTIAAGQARPAPFDAIVLFSSFGFGDVGSLPPTLVLSGGSHDAVPVADAVALHQALVAAHVPTALHVYPNGTHAWPGPQFDAGLAWTLSFLKKYL